MPGDKSTRLESQPTRIDNLDRGTDRVAPKRPERRTDLGEPLFKPLNRPESERLLIPFGLAEPVIMLINQVQDANDEREKDLTASPADIEKARRINREFGDKDDAERLADPFQAIVYAQEVIRNSRIADPTPEELHYMEGAPHIEGGTNGDGLKKIWQMQIAKAQGRNLETGEDEEIFDVKKAEKHVEVESDYGDGVANDKGPGAMAGGADPAWYDSLPDPDTVTDAALARTIRGIQRIGASKEDELSRLKRMQEKLDDIAAETPEAKSAERILNTRIRELRDEATRMRDDEIKKSRETPMAEHLLTVTTYMKSIFKELLATDRALVPDKWNDLAGQLRRIVEVAETATETVEAVEIDAPNPDDMFAHLSIKVDGKDEKIDMASARFVFEVAKAVDDTYRGQDDEGKDEIVAALSTLALSGDKVVNKFTNWNDERTHLYRRIHNRYSQIYENDSTENQRAKVGDIVVKGNYYLGAMLTGWRDLEQASTDILGTIYDKEDPIGLRQWKATRYYYTLEQALEEHQTFTPPGDPGDVPKNIARIFSWMEDLGLGAEELRPFIQRAKAQLEVVPARSKEGRDMRAALADRIDASALMLSVYMVLEEKDMHPGAVEGILAGFEGKKETTIENYVARFGEDTRGRRFYVGRADGGYEGLNTFDVSLQELYSKDLNDDRIRANMVEELTRLKIDGDGDFSSGLIAEIKEREGYADLDKSWKTKKVVDGKEYRDRWEYEFYKLRAYFRERTRMLIGKNTASGGKWEGATLGVDDVWARLKGVKRGLVDEKREFILETEKMSFWYLKEGGHRRNAKWG